MSSRRNLNFRLLEAFPKIRKEISLRNLFSCRLFIILSAVFFVSLLIAYTTYLSAAYAVSRVDVTIPNNAPTGFHFQPKTITIEKGSTVRWNNNADELLHAVAFGIPTGDGQGPDSNFIFPGQSFELQFDKVGEFPYFCSLHPGGPSGPSDGTVIVKDILTPTDTNFTSSSESLTAEKDINLKNIELRERGFSGQADPTTPLPITAPSRDGYYQNFIGYSIWWSNRTGAHEIHGAILQEWERTGGTNGLGYPLSDETPLPGSGGEKYSQFQNGYLITHPGGVYFSSALPSFNTVHRINVIFDSIKINNNHDPFGEGGEIDLNAAIYSGNASPSSEFALHRYTPGGTAYLDSALQGQTYALDKTKLITLGDNDILNIEVFGFEVDGAETDWILCRGDRTFCENDDHELGHISKQYNIGTNFGFGFHCDISTETSNLEDTLGDYELCYHILVD